MKILIEKGQKNKDICANFEIESRFQALQNTVVSISEVDVSIWYRIKFIATRNQIKSKKTGPLRRKNGYQLSITVIYICNSVKNCFSKSKSHSLNAAHDKKTSLA